MRVLIVHHEARYHGGAEVLLGDFLGALSVSGIETTVALARDSRVANALNAAVRVVHLPTNDPFSPSGFAAQLRALGRVTRSGGFDVVHGWAARDWEIAAAAAAWSRRPAIGTLHDHPHAAYISRRRRTLMRLVANGALRRLVCPSEAVRGACTRAGYRDAKLTVIHNGIPLPRREPGPIRDGPMRIGFLGVFSEGKGLDGLFEMVDHLDTLHPGAWELWIGGAAQNARGEQLAAAIRERYAASAWWQRVRWLGWVDDQAAFLRELDVLACPFTQFEAFGLVVCEAGAAGLPVVAASVGAISEIVEHERTGWLFRPGDWREGSRLLANLMENPGDRERVGENARRRVEQAFAIETMAAGYGRLYSELA